MTLGEGRREGRESTEHSATGMEGRMPVVTLRVKWIIRFVYRSPGALVKLTSRWRSSNA